jgi:hypothetical protein
MSLNDHGWGNQPGGGKRGGNQGPPDLEELWRDFNRRLAGLLATRVAAVAIAAEMVAAGVGCRQSVLDNSEAGSGSS